MTDLDNYYKIKYLKYKKKYLDLQKAGGKYEDNKDTISSWKNENIWKIKKGDIARFYWVTLQGALGSPADLIGARHLCMEILSEKEDSKKKPMVLGFYPKGGDIAGSLVKYGLSWLSSYFKNSEGEIWLPDPHFVSDEDIKKYLKEGETIDDFRNKNRYLSELVTYGDYKNESIIYIIDDNQATTINDILKNKECRLKKKESSSAKVKKTRLECPEGKYDYCVVSGEKEKNCITWLQDLFKDLYYDISGKNKPIVKDYTSRKLRRRNTKENIVFRETRVKKRLSETYKKIELGKDVMNNRKDLLNDLFGDLFN